jgi:hypothetical protein
MLPEEIIYLIQGFLDKRDLDTFNIFLEFVFTYKYEFNYKVKTFGKSCEDFQIFMYENIIGNTYDTDLLCYYFKYLHKIPKSYIYAYFNMLLPSDTFLNSIKNHLDFYILKNRNDIVKIIYKFMDNKYLYNVEELINARTYLTMDLEYFLETISVYNLVGTLENTLLNTSKNTLLNTSEIYYIKKNRNFILPYEYGYWYSFEEYLSDYVLFNKHYNYASYYIIEKKLSLYTLRRLFNKYPSFLNSILKN